MSSSKARISFWEAETFIGRPDVVIVGAGFTGLRAALALKEQAADKSVLVVDRHPFGLGASTRNAGFACFGSPTELLADLAVSPAETVWDTVAKRYAGVRRLAQEAASLPQLFQWDGGYEVFDNREKYEAVVAQLPALNAELSRCCGPDAIWQETKAPASLRPGISVLYNAAEGKLQPAALLADLQARCRAAGVQLAYGCTVDSFSGRAGNMQLHTQPLGTINCDQILLATNAFSNELGLELDVVPCRNLVVLTQVVPDLQLPGTYHHHEGYVYFRTVDRPEGPRLLMGGARHLARAAEQTAEFGIGEDLRKSLKKYLQDFIQLPEDSLKMEYSWSGIIAQGREKSPIVRRLHEGLVVAVRLSGMGVALSAEVGEQAAKLLCE
ncbi:MAG: FAD-dependent oxidoreductase [Bacteroidota bacterium]